MFIRREQLAKTDRRPAVKPLPERFPAPRSASGGIGWGMGPG